MSTYNKMHRILDIFYMGISNRYFSASELSDKYNISKKTVARDINEVRSFLFEYRDTIGNADIIYDRKKLMYHLEYTDKITEQQKKNNI